MSFIELVSVSIALGLDASGVCISLGLGRRVNKNIALIIIFLFSFFQFLFAFLGGILGNLFHMYIFDIPSVYGGIILLFLGIIIVLEGFSSKEKKIKIKLDVIFLLAISVSIDALVVGFSIFSDLLNNIIIKNSIFVGFITSVLCTLAFFISKYVRKVAFIKEYADFIAGSVLMIIGIKMIL